MKKVKYAGELVAIVILSAVSAVNYAVFIFPNQFAPAGLDGLCTMFQELTDINIGYSAFIINIPLLIISCRKLSRDFAIKNIFYIVTFSLVSAILGQVDISRFCYYTTNGTSIVLAPIAAGVIRGIIYAFAIKLNGGSGGVDIIAALIRKKAPHFNLMSIIFVLNMSVALCSYFVYGNQLEPVICGIVYFYITSQTSTQLQLLKKEKVKIEIITQSPQAICSYITEKLHLSATVLDSHGAYSKIGNKMVVCIAQKKSIALIKDSLKDFPDAVYFTSTVNEAYIRH